MYYCQIDQYTRLQEQIGHKRDTKHTAFCKYWRHLTFLREKRMACEWMMLPTTVYRWHTFRVVNLVRNLDWYLPDQDFDDFCSVPWPETTQWMCTKWVSKGTSVRFTEEAKSKDRRTENNQEWMRRMVVKILWCVPIKGNSPNLKNYPI